MRLAKHEEEQRRVNIVAFLAGEPKTSRDICDFDGTIATDNMAVFITRLRKKGVVITKHSRGHYIAYKLDMPLADALKCVTPKGYAPSTARHIRAQDPERIAARKATKRAKADLDKAKKEHVPAGEFHPWWGIIASRQTIDIGETSCK